MSGHALMAGEGGQAKMQCGACVSAREVIVFGGGLWVRRKSSCAEVGTGLGARVAVAHHSAERLVTSIRDLELCVPHTLL